MLAATASVTTRGGEPTVDVFRNTSSSRRSNCLRSLAQYCGSLSAGHPGGFAGAAAGGASVAGASVGTAAASDRFRMKSRRESMPGLLRRLAPILRIERVPESVAKKIEAQQRERERQPREDHQPRKQRQHPRPIRDERAPRSIRRLDAEAQEREKRLLQ